MFGIKVLDKEIKRIVIDSRSARAGDLFVAYKGEKVDGNDYIDDALKNGASAVLAERYEGDGPVLVVDDVQRAVEELVAEFRSKLTIPIIGITGSAGKTTTKEMIASVLSEKYRVLKTEGNLNNTIGVPLTLSRISEDDEVVVIEMGINHFGEMTHLANMVRPTIMVFTNIGHAHLEFLQSLDGVFKAKTEVLNVCSPVVVANGEDPYLSNLDGIHYFSDTICDPPAYGRHIRYAMSAATAVGHLLGLNDNQIISGINKFKVVGRRGVINKGFVTLVDDSYNANPDSMRLAIDSLLDIEGRRHVCVFGKMLEQGNDSSLLHHQIGEYAKQHGCILMQKNADYGGIEYDIKLLEKDDVVLVKGSLGSKMSEVADSIKKLDKPCVFLDVDDTILDWVQTEKHALTKTLLEFGITPNDEMIEKYASVNLSWWEKLERGEITREEVMVGRFNEFFSFYGIEADSYVVQEYYENTLCDGYFYMDDSKSVLESIKDKYRLFVASNGVYKVTSSRLKNAGCIDYFEDLFISEKVGFEKPNPEFLNIASKSIVNFNPSNALIVGDSLTSDILEGINFGIKTVWFNVRGRQNRPDIVPDYTIYNINDLPDLLDKIFKASE